MTYISANIMGLFFIGLLIFDMSTNSWGDLPVHAAIGIILTLFYTGVCYIIGEAISSAILFVPAIFLFAFLLASWLLRNNLIKQHCCVKCSGHTPSPNPTPLRPTPSPNPTPLRPTPCSRPTPYSNWWIWDYIQVTRTPVSNKCKPVVV